MTRGKLTKLNQSHHLMLSAFLNQLKNMKEPIHGYFLDLDEPFHQALKTLDAWQEGESLPVDWVPSSTWFWERDGAFLGVINLRHHLSPALESFGGHVGYTVAPAFRRQGVAKAMLMAMGQYALALGIPRLLATCDARNFGSVGVIEGVGGVLWREEWVDRQQCMQRWYWIDVSGLLKLHESSDG